MLIIDFKFVVGNYLDGEGKEMHVIALSVLFAFSTHRKEDRKYKEGGKGVMYKC